MCGYWLFIVIEAFVMHLLLPTDALAMADIVYVGFICVNTCLLMMIVGARYGHDRMFVVLFIGGLLFRIFLMFWSEYCSHIFVLPNSGTDEMTYYYNAMSNLVKGTEFEGYAKFFAWQARIFGLSKIYGKFINVLFSASAILILRQILIECNVRYSVAVTTIALACFLPNFAITSCLLLRESAVVLLVAVSSYFLLRWWNRSHPEALILSLAASVAAAWLHSGMIAYTLGILCVAVISRRTIRGRQFSLTSPRTVLLTALTVTVLLLALINSGSTLASYFRGVDSLEDIVAVSDAYEDGGSAYNANIVSNESTVGFIINTPVRMFYFMFAPLPWNWRSAADIIAFVFSGLFYGYVFFKAASLALKGGRYPLISAAFLIMLLVVMIFGWGVSNSGTALRHRDKMVIHFLLVFALLQETKIPGRPAEGSM
jgi:hypothetical protein